MNNRTLFLNNPTSTLGYGCYALSGAYGARLEENERIKLLQYAYELGIRYYDTAGSYTDTEEILGRAVKAFRHEIVISSKVGLKEGNIIDLSKENIRASCEASLKKLNTDYLDIYMVHYHDPNTPVNDTIEAMEALKKEGKIRHYGVGHLPLDKTVEYLNLGDISIVLAEMSPANTFRYRELRSLQTEYDFGIIAFSITGRGILSGKIDPDTQFSQADIRRIDPLFKKAKMYSALRIAEKLKEVGSRYQKTPAQAAISWTIQKPGVIAGLTGPTKMEHLYENSRVLSWSLDRTDIEEIDMVIEAEEKKLKETLYQEVRNILSSPLPGDFEQASNDLIYVLECAAENGFLPYEKSIDCFMKIISITKENNKSIDALNEIKEDLKRLT